MLVIEKIYFTVAYIEGGGGGGAALLNSEESSLTLRAISQFAIPSFQT